MNHLNQYSENYNEPVRGHDFAPGFIDPSSRVEDFCLGRTSVSPSRGRYRERSRSPYGGRYNQHDNYDNYLERDNRSRNMRFDNVGEDDQGNYGNNRGRNNHQHEPFMDEEFENDRYERRERKTNSRYSDRSRNRSRSRSQDYDRDDSRDRRYRNHSRDRRREDDRDGEYYMGRTTHKVRDRDYRRGDYDRYENSTSPSSTVIIQSLSYQANEDMIKNILQMDGVQAKTVAIIRDRNGDSRGFAFVEFDDIVTAELWLKITKRQVLIDDQRSYLNFSRSKKFESISNTNSYNDWNCFDCGALNFGSKRKTMCFQCGKPKKEAKVSSEMKNDKQSEVIKLDPCNVLMLRGMSFSTTEDTIRMEISKLTNHPIYDVRLIKDKVTDMSRGFAFVELGTTEHATSLLDAVDKCEPTFEIEGRKITVGYARHGYNAPISTSKTPNHKARPAPSSISKQTLVENAVAQASAANSSTLQYSKSMVDPSYAPPGANQQHRTQAASSHQANYNQPDLTQSSYSFDATTGFYYDSTTGLYYDPNSGYYYNGTTGQYLYWNGSKYQAVNQDGSTANTDSTTTAVTREGAQQDEKPARENEQGVVSVQGQKPKTARKIAKDMERWAKKMNTANEAKKHAVKQAQDELRLLERKEEQLRKQIQQEKHIVTTLDTVVRNKDGVRSLFVPDNDEEGSVLKLGAALVPSTSTKPVVQLVADVLDDDDLDIVDESRFVDTVKLTCLLCKRQFPNKEVLTKHLQMSQLHKQNIENFKKNSKK